MVQDILLGLLHSFEIERPHVKKKLEVLANVSTEDVLWPGGLFLVMLLHKNWKKLLVWQLFFFSSFNIYLLFLFFTKNMGLSLSHAFTIPSQRCNTTYLQLSENSDKNCCHGNIFTLNFFSFSLWKSHYISFYLKLFHIFLSKLVCLLEFIHRIF